MPTAKKQPSGQWKCRVYSHIDKDGRQHYRSFTAPTKAEAEQIAAEFSGKADRFAQSDLTVQEAVHAYIDAKEGVLSPSTVLGYRRMEKTRFAPIASKKIKKLTSVDVQTFISELSKTLSPKTVSNIYGLLSASVSLFQPDKTFRIKLPTKKKKRATGAASPQIIELFNRAPRQLQISIALSAFASLRRGEICALKYGDISGNMLHVHADMVLGVDGWHYKETPKTSDSDRFTPLPQALIDLIGEGEPDAFIIDWCPDTITKRFIELRNEVGISIRFHDLRSYYASIGAALIPDIYLASFGGWTKSSKVMKETYQKEITDMSKEYASKMTGYFDALILGHDLGHDFSSPVAKTPKTRASQNGKNKDKKTSKT